MTEIPLFSFCYLFFAMHLTVGCLTMKIGSVVRVRDAKEDREKNQPRSKALSLLDQLQGRGEGNEKRASRFQDFTRPFFLAAFFRVTRRTKRKRDLSVRYICTCMINFRFRLKGQRMC